MVVTELISTSNLLPIEILLQIVFNKYLTDSYCVTFVTENSLNFQILTSFMYVSPNETKFNELVDQLWEVSEKGCSDFIIRMKEPKIFIEAFERVTHLSTARRSDKKVIILPYTEDKNSMTTLLEILPMKETGFIANLLLILPAPTRAPGCTTYEMVTHHFVGPDETAHQADYLDKWTSCTERFEKDVNLFPHDMSNMYGKTLNVACFNYKPYVLLDLKTVASPSGRDGTEMRMVEEFCRWINCTIQLVRDEAGQWGEIYDNMTGIGVIGNVVTDKADMGISALYSWYEEFLYLDFSVPSIRTAITCIAPAPRLIVSWEMPLLPFTWSVWTGLVLTFCSSSLALVIAQGGSSDKVLITAFGMLAAQSQKDTGWRIRSVTGWLLLAGLVLCNAYGAGLATTFTVPKYEQSVDKIQDLIDRKMEWGATHDAWIYSLTLSSEPKINQLVGQFRIYSFDELKQKSFTRNMAFSIEKLPAGYFAIGEYITKEAVLDLMLMREDFYYEQNVVMLRKSSPYTHKISDLIGRLHETGLMFAWETQIALKYLDYKVQLEVKLSRSKENVEIKPLCFQNIVGIFYFFLFGTGLSVVFFTMEVVYKRKNNLLSTI